MRYKGKLFFLCVSLTLTLILLCGCSKSGKSEKEIIKDLQANPVFIATDIEISDYDIIKRQTDTENKTDVIYITVHTNAPELTSSLTYELKYELYNEGWILESVMRYYDGPWEFSGLSDEQLLEDIKENDYYFSDWNLDVENIEVTNEFCDSSAMSYYQKTISVDLLSHSIGFDYFSSYNMFYIISDGRWQLESADVQARKYVPKFTPDVSETDKIMDTLEYDNYEFLNIEEDLDNCKVTVYYIARTEYELGTETYTVSIPITYSLESGPDSAHWSYFSSDISSKLSLIDWDIQGIWSANGDGSKNFSQDEWNIYLEIDEIIGTDDPYVYLARAMSNSIYRDIAFIELNRYYCITDSFTDGIITRQGPGKYKLEIESTIEGEGVSGKGVTKGIFSIELGDGAKEESGIWWAGGGGYIKLYRG